MEGAPSARVAPSEGRGREDAFGGTAPYGWGGRRGLSATATAAATPASWVIVTWMRAIPRPRASSAVAPWSATSGAPPGSRRTSMSVQRTPRAQPVPSTFITASLTAKRPA